MDCLGRTKPLLQLRRCQKPARFLFCWQHRFQPLILIFTISSIVGLYAGIFQDLVKPLSQHLASEISTPADNVNQPFPENDGSFKVLILPFDPLEDCTTQESDLAKAIYKRLVSLKEQDTLEINVKYETTQACPATFAEGKSIGNDFNADLVIWGETYEKCLLDTAKACLKYVILKEARYNIERVGNTGIQNFVSMAEITQGYLQRDIDYIIYWTLGLEAYTQQNYNAAVGYFKKIEADFSEQYEELFSYLGLAYSRLNQYDKSLDAFEAAVNIKPDAQNHNNYAIALTIMKDYDGAQKHYTEALRINPDDVSTHTHYAHLLSDFLQDYNGAKKHYTEALRINPDYASAHNGYANLLRGLKDYNGAREHYTEMLRINPDDADAHYSYANLLMDLKDYDGAKKRFTEALRINPDYAAAHNNYAILLMTVFKDYDGAKKHYAEALRIEPNNAVRHSNYATVLMIMKDYDGAKKHWGEALRIEPDDASVHSKYAIVLRVLKDYDGAKKHFTEALRINPNDAVTHSVYATLLHALKDFDGAKKHYSEALRIKPDYAAAHYNYANLLSKHFQDYDEAQQHYLRACKLDSSLRNQKADEIFGVTANKTRSF